MKINIATSCVNIWVNRLKIRFQRRLEHSILNKAKYLLCYDASIIYK